MWFQRNLLLQKFQAESDSRREHLDALLGPARAVVCKEYALARCFADPIAASFERLAQQNEVAEQLLKEGATPPAGPAPPVKTGRDAPESPPALPEDAPAPEEPLVRSQSEQRLVPAAAALLADQLQPNQRPSSTHRSRTARQRDAQREAQLESQRDAR